MYCFMNGRIIYFLQNITSKRSKQTLGIQNKHLCLETLSNTAGNSNSKATQNTQMSLQNSCAEILE